MIYLHLDIFIIDGGRFVIYILMNDKQEYHSMGRMASENLIHIQYLIQYDSLFRGLPGARSELELFELLSSDPYLRHIHFLIMMLSSAGV